MNSDHSISITVNQTPAGPRTAVPVGTGELVRRASNLRKLLQKEMREIANRRKHGHLGIGIDDDPDAVKYRQRMRADTRCARFLYHGNIWTPLWRSWPNNKVRDARAESGASPSVEASPE